MQKTCPIALSACEVRPHEKVGEGRKPEETDEAVEDGAAAAEAAVDCVEAAEEDGGTKPHAALDTRLSFSADSGKCTKHRGCHTEAHAHTEPQ